MHSFEFLDELVILSLVALLIIIVFQRFKLPPVIGLIATGLVLGPTGLSFVREGEIITSAAEIGVVMLLFTIGLEFSLDKLHELRRIVLIAGPLQVIFSTCVAGLAAALIAVVHDGVLSFNAAVLMGMCAALSSTAICIKLLKDANDLQSPHGGVVMGILIFQDIAVVPMMIITTMLVSNNGINVGEILYRIGVLVVVVMCLVVGLRFVLPRLVPYVTRIAAPEVLILGGLVLCFGVAWITSAVGLSMALGAFIAGVAIAGSEDGHQIAEVIEPIRDVFTSLFFLSIGLLVDISWSTMPLNVLSAIAIVAVNALVLIAVLTSMKVPRRTAIIASLILAQVGEFSFVLASLGKETHILSDVQYQNLLVSIIITMIVTPLLVRYAPRIASRVATAADVTISER